MRFQIHCYVVNPTSSWPNTQITSSLGLFDFLANSINTRYMRSIWLHTTDDRGTTSAGEPPRTLLANAKAYGLLGDDRAIKWRIKDMKNMEKVEELAYLVWERILALEAEFGGFDRDKRIKDIKGKVGRGV